MYVVSGTYSVSNKQSETGRNLLNLNLVEVLTYTVKSNQLQLQDYTGGNHYVF